MNQLLFATARNSIWRKWFSGKITFKKDGDYFVREMEAMGDQWTNPTMVKCYKKAYWLRRRMFIEELKASIPRTIAIFCHGSKHWIFGIGYNRKNIKQLAQYIKNTGTEKVFIILYACSCGKGKGDRYPIGTVPKKAGVAMMLADELAKLGVNFKIIAHTTRGRATMNPYCVFITKELNMIFKQVVIKRVTRWQGKKDPIGRKRWLRWIEMLEENTDFRFKFPYMKQRQVVDIVDGKPH